MNKFLHILNARPIDIPCVDRRVVLPSWVDVYGLTKLARVEQELKVLDFFLGDDFISRNLLFRNSNSKYPLVLDLLKRGLIEKKEGTYTYRTTDAGWEYMRAHAMNETQRESLSLGNCMNIRAEIAA